MISRSDIGVASGTDDPDQSLVQGKGSLKIVRGTDRRRSGVIAREGDNPSHAQSVTRREDAAHFREIRAAEITQAASDDHLRLLQQANSRLVTSAIEAQILAAKLQITKDQMDHLAHHDVLTDLPNRVLL